MPKITIHNDSDISTTRVSNIFIDDYMSNANGEFVKIYLYLLRLMNAPDTSIPLSSIADKFDHTEKDVKRALCYWERMKLLRLEYDESKNLTGIYLLDSMPKARETSEPSTDRRQPQIVTDDSSIVKADFAKAKSLPTNTAPKTIIPPKKSYTADDIKTFRENEQIAELLFITERYLRRTLTPSDMDTLFYFYDRLGFSSDLIEYLIEYCVSKGHISIRYIEATALKWAEQNIHTVAEAKHETQSHSQTYLSVKKAFGISERDFIPSETDYIKKWQSDYGFSLEIITAACKRTIQSIHTPSFPYTDSILKNWKKQQVHNLSDIERIDEEHQNKRNAEGRVSSPSENISKNKFNNFSQRSYDYDKLEKMLLTTDVQ